MPEHRLILKVDQTPINPRSEYGFGSLACVSHSRQGLGDECALDLVYDLLKERGSRKVQKQLDDDDVVESFSSMYKLLQESNLAIILPVYMYDHGGIALRTTPFSCRWDSGQIGYIFIPKWWVRQEYGWKYLTKARITQVEGYLSGAVETYSQYVSGDVWGFVTETDGEKVDSMWGFYGDDPTTNSMLEYLESPVRELALAGNYVREY